MAFIWIVLNGAITFMNLAWGIVIGAASLWFAIRFMKPSRISGVRFIKLTLYPFYLLGQVYCAGFLVIKRIIYGCRTEVVTVETAVTNDFLRTLLCNSITMIPGSAVLDRNDSKLTIVVLLDKNAPPLTAETAKAVIKGPESRLLKAQA
jgi:multisubunit Na+/H+ antiporter MnhE subunit